MNPSPVSGYIDRRSGPAGPAYALIGTGWDAEVTGGAP
jgi:hypothetical protein